MHYDINVFWMHSCFFFYFFNQKLKVHFTSFNLYLFPGTFSASTSISSIEFETSVASLLAFSICLRNVNRCTRTDFMKEFPKSQSNTTLFKLFFTGVDRDGFAGDDICKERLTMFSALLMLSTNLSWDWKFINCMHSWNTWLLLRFSDEHLE